MRNDPKTWQPEDIPNTAGSMPAMVQSEPWEQCPSCAALFRSISLSESCSEDQSDMLRPQYPSLYLTWSQSPVFSTSRQYFSYLTEISVHRGSFCNTPPSILHETIFLFFRRSMYFPRQGRNLKPLPLSYTQSSACFFDISENSFPIHCAPAPVVLRHNLLHCTIQMIVNGAGSASFFVSNIRWTVPHQQLLNNIPLAFCQTA